MQRRDRPGTVAVRRLRMICLGEVSLAPSRVRAQLGIATVRLYNPGCLDKLARLLRRHSVPCSRSRASVLCSPASAELVSVLSAAAGGRKYQSASTSDGHPRTNVAKAHNAAAALGSIDFSVNSDKCEPACFSL